MAMWGLPKMARKVDSWFRDCKRTQADEWDVSSCRGWTCPAADLTRRPLVPCQADREDDLSLCNVGCVNGAMGILDAWSLPEVAWFCRKRSCRCFQLLKIKIVFPCLFSRESITLENMLFHETSANGGCHQDMSRAVPDRSLEHVLHVAFVWLPPDLMRKIFRHVCASWLPQSDEGPYIS